MKKNIILVGGGGHCISCIDVIEQLEEYQIVGILDLPAKAGSKILGIPVIGNDDDISQLNDENSFFLITTGQIKSAKTRKKIYSQIDKFNIPLPTIVSPIAYVSKHSKLEKGTIIMHNAIVNAGAEIGMCNIINTKALIEHEAKIGDFCHISTGTIINGQAKIGNGCFIGSNTVVANNITVCDNVIVSAGSQVLKDITEPGVYIGSPLRRIR